MYGKLLGPQVHPAAALGKSPQGDRLMVDSVVVRIPQAPCLRWELPACLILTRSMSGLRTLGPNQIPLRKALRTALRQIRGGTALVY